MKAKQVIVMLLAMISFMCFGLSFNKIEAASGDTYSLVTNVSNLSVGNKIIIVNADKDKVLSTTQNTNNRGAVSVTDSNGVISYVEGVQEIELVEGITSGSFGFKVDENYLYADSSKNNYLKSSTTLDSNGSWKITITSTETKIVAQGSNTRNTFRYNGTNGSSLFSCYSNKSTTGTGVLVYKKVENTTSTTVDLTSSSFSSTSINTNLKLSYNELVSNEVYIVQNDSPIFDDSACTFTEKQLSNCTITATNGSTETRYYGSSTSFDLRIYKGATLSFSNASSIISIKFEGEGTFNGSSEQCTKVQNAGDLFNVNENSTFTNNQIVFNISINTRISKIIIDYKVNPNISVYKDFDVTMGVKLNFNPADFSDLVYYSGIIISNKELSLSENTTLPTNVENSESKIIVKDNADLLKEYSINIHFKDISSCKGTLYIYGYVNGIKNNTEFTYYTNARVVSVSNLLDEYSGNSSLSDYHPVFTALKSSISNAN